MNKISLSALALSIVLTLPGCDGLDLSQLNLPTTDPEITAEAVQISSFFNYRYNRRGKSSLGTVLGASAGDGGTTDPNILAPPANARDFSRWMGGIDAESGQIFFLLNPEQEEREDNFSPTDFSVQVWTKTGIEDWISAQTDALGEYKLTAEDIKAFQALLKKGPIFNLTVAIESENLEATAFASASADAFEIANLEMLAEEALSTCESGELEDKVWDWSGAHDFSLVSEEDLNRLNIAKPGIYCGLGAEE